MCRPDLRYGDGALPGQVLFGLLTGVRVCQMGVKICIQNLCRLLAEVSSFSSGRKGRFQKLTFSAISKYTLTLKD